MLECAVIFFSGGFSPQGDPTHVSYISTWILYLCQLWTGTWQEHLPVTEQQQACLPSASVEIEPCAAAAPDL